MRFSPAFYRTAAVCSIISAGTTLCLIFLPRLYHPAEGFEGNLARIHDSAYTARLWIYFFHPFLVATAALGIAVRKRGEAAGVVLPGFLLFSVWAFTEMLQQSLALVANHYAWRGGYSSADPATQQMIRTQMFGFEAIWDGLYMLLLVGFIGANTLYAVAMFGRSRLELTLRWMFFAAAALSVFNWLSVFRIALAADPVLEWVYPLLQPLARVLIGVWLWRNSDETLPRSADSENAPGD